MNRPSLLVRIAGAPLPAFLLFVGYFLIVAGWLQGRIVWWLGLFAIGAAIRTLSAVRQVRSYKAWMADWNAMGGREQTVPKNKRVSHPLLVTSAALVVLIVPSVAQQFPHDTGLRFGLQMLWLASFVYLVTLLLASMTRWLMRFRRAKSEPAATPVEWTLGRASSSPSRSQAARQVPDYCARLLRS